LSDLGIESLGTLCRGCPTPFDCAQGGLLRSLQGWEFRAGCYFEKWDAGREIFARQAVYSLSIRQKYFLGSEVCDQNREKVKN
jgi:hypothetical protein